jgi:hypothetical protein
VVRLPKCFGYFLKRLLGIGDGTVNVWGLLIDTQGI